MVLIYAEKKDMGKKIAAALDAIHFPGGKTVRFEELATNDSDISRLQNTQGYLDITFNGEPAKVTWGSGHVCELKQAYDYNPDYKSWYKLPVPFIPENYEVKPSIGSVNPKGDRERMKRFKSLFKEADWYINATDFDREGEVIFGYLYEYLNCKKPFKRAHFTAQTKEGIREGFKNLKESAEIHAIEMAGRARAIADADIGWNLTAQTTLKIGGKGVKSVGRVQTVVLNAIVQRELEIQNFKPVPFYTLQSVFTTDSGETYKGLHTTKRFDKKADADAILAKIKGYSGVVRKVDVSHRTQEVPLLYSLAALQMDASGIYGFSLAETLELAQSLYDGGYTTYPRAKSRCLNDDMRPVVTKTLDALESVPEFHSLIVGRPRTYAPKFFNSAAVDSHFAIIPTGVIPTKLNDKQKKLYNLICFSLIRMLYPDAKMDTTKITTEVRGENFISDGTMITDKGWMAVGAIKSDEKFLPLLSVDERVDSNASVAESKTKAPPSYTDKTIVAWMIAAGNTVDDKELSDILKDPSIEGIGQESTRAAILETLVKRGYIKREGKNLKATQEGINLIDFLPIADLKSAALTAKWEKRLSGIAKGTESYEGFIEDIERTTREWTMMINKSGASPSVKEKTMETSTFKCPVCGKSMNKFGWGYSCSGHERDGSGCPFTLGSTILGKTLSEKNISDIFEKGETDKISGFKSNKTGKKFDAKLKLEDGKVKFSFDN